MSKKLLRFLPARFKRALVKRPLVGRILRNTGWLTGEHIWRIAASFTVTVVLARYLGPQEFGVYRYSLALIALCGSWTDLGLRGIVVRDLVEHPESKRTLLGTTFLLRGFAGCAAWGVTTLAIGLLRPDSATSRLFVTVASTMLVFRAFEVVDVWYRSQVASQYAVGAKVVGFTLGTGAKLVLVLLDAPLNAFAWAIAGEAAVIAVCYLTVYVWTQRDLSRWRFTVGQACDFLSRSWPLILSGLGAVVYFKIDQVMLGELVSDTEVGIYSVAAQVSEAWYFLPAALASSAFPPLLKIRSEDPEQYGEKLQSLYNFLVGSALLLSVPVSLLAEPLVDLVFGSEYQAAGFILSIHIWASVFMFARAALSKWLVAEDLYIYSLVTHGLGAVVNVVLNLLLIPYLAGVGAAIATVLSYATASYFALFVSSKTRPAARMMTTAFVAPLVLIGKTVGDKSLARFDQ